MGADYSARAAIGVLIDQDALYTTETVKAFDHNYPPDVLFCPKTGKKCWEEQHTPIEGYDPEGPELKGYPLVYSTDHDDAVVAWEEVRVRDGDKHHAMIHLSDMDVKKVMTEMEKALKPAGLWKKKNFGLHVLLRCSY